MYRDNKRKIILAVLLLLLNALQILQVLIACILGHTTITEWFHFYRFFLYLEVLDKMLTDKSTDWPGSQKQLPRVLWFFKPLNLTCLGIKHSPNDLVLTGNSQNKFLDHTEKNFYWRDSILFKNFVDIKVIFLLRAYLYMLVTEESRHIPLPFSNSQSSRENNLKWNYNKL